MIRFLAGILLGAFVGYGMGSYAMLARVLRVVDEEPNVEPVDDMTAEDIRKLYNSPIVGAHGTWTWEGDN